MHSAKTILTFQTSYKVHKKIRLYIQAEQTLTVINKILITSHFKLILIKKSY